jgi:hypothetical protein
VSKYDPLRRRLEGTSQPIVDMTFEEIAHLVGGLPHSAYKHSAWWANDEGRHVQARAWLDASFTTERIDLAARWVRFRRGGRAMGTSVSAQRAEGG